jgi:CHAD domain-containing protein
VHEVRKSTKRLRGLIRLVGPVMPAAAQENTCIRDAAGTLSDLRDAGALFETLDLVSIPAADREEIREALARRPARRASSGAAGKLDAFGSVMRAAAGRSTHWQITAAGFEAIAPGLERGLKRFRKSLEQAASDAAEEPMHDWRKRAKDHWYHTVLLREIFPDVMKGHARAGERLSDALGRWRDLGLLEDAIAAMPAHEVAKMSAALALESIALARPKAKKQALKIGRLLAAETPSQLSKRWRAYWDAVM